ncbi:hypothetical protein C8Q74DRAFT_1272379 [Fomes fomentarius]|nr:hypothetical protein C8Q74DRAFT_1272379 [Fomes fomentarius]
MKVPACADNSIPCSLVAMHRALLIHEIVGYICQFSYKPELASLAGCSKTFHQPAIQALWSDIPNLAPLIRCFPQDAWVVEENTVVSKHNFGFVISLSQRPMSRGQKLVRPLAPEDWERFLHYSHYVLHLGRPYKSGDLEVDVDAVSSMAAYRPVLVILPRLVTFITDRLRLAAYATHWQLLPVGHLQTTLCLVTHRFPRLDEFLLLYGPGFVRLIEEPVIIPSSFLQVAQELSHLTSFICTGIPMAENTFHALSRLPKLLTLKIVLPTSLAWSPGALIAQFPSLRTLCLTSRARDYIAFSAVTTFFHVTSVELDIKRPPRTNDIPLLFDAICQQFESSSLTCLSITTFWHCGAVIVPVDSVIHPLHLRSLLRFGKLEHLEVDVACRYALDCPFYTELARALPLLTQVTIGTGPFCMHDSFPTISALAPFALHCPNLTRLGVYFAARGCCSDDALEADRCSRDTCLCGAFATSVT